MKKVLKNLNDTLQGMDDALHTAATGEPVPVKISVTLTRSQYDTLQKLAKEQGIAAADALQKAIVTEGFIKDQIKAGKKILIQDRDNTIQQIIFR